MDILTFQTFLTRGDRKMGHMGIMSFQKFLAEVQKDLANPHIQQHGVNDGDTAKLYHKMSQYTSRFIPE